MVGNYHYVVSLSQSPHHTEKCCWMPIHFVLVSRKFCLFLCSLTRYWEYIVAATSSLYSTKLNSSIVLYSVAGALRNTQGDVKCLQSEWPLYPCMMLLLYISYCVAGVIGSRLFSYIVYSTVGCCTGMVSITMKLCVECLLVYCVLLVDSLLPTFLSAVWWSFSLCYTHLWSFSFVTFGNDILN